MESNIKNKEIYQKGIAFWQSNNLIDAKKTFEKLLKESPNNPEILSFIGIINLQLNQFEYGIKFLKLALKFSPNDQNIKLNLANALINFSNDLIKSNRFDDAGENLEEAIKLIPTNEIALINLIKLNNETKNYKKIDEIYENLNKFNLHNPDIFFLIGNSLFDQKKYQKALEMYSKVIDVKPDNVECLFNMALCYQYLDNFEMSLEKYRLCFEFDPNYKLALFNLSLLFLRNNDFKNGWKYYKYRWFLEKNKGNYLFDQGSELKSLKSISGKTLIWAEQGLGDQILFSSMLNSLIKFSKKLTLSLDKRLIPLYIRSFPSIKFISSDDFINQKDFENHLPLGSLGQYLRNSMKDFSDQPNYFLKCNKNLKDDLKKKIKISNKLVCGFSITSLNENYGNSKSVEIDDFFKNLKKLDYKFINLDYVDNTKEILKASKKYNLDIEIAEDIDKFNDIDSLAALISSCDLVISISNITAHLAGALGVNTYLLVPSGKGKFWYWYDEKYSKWYPSITIKTSKENEWESTLQDLESELMGTFG